jgi:hypothetical protein
MEQAAHHIYLAQKTATIMTDGFAAEAEMSTGIIRALIQQERLKLLALMLSHPP